jgi:hypothetical protein
MAMPHEHGARARSAVFSRAPLKGGIVGASQHMTSASDEMRRALEGAQESYRAACHGFRQILHRALPAVEHLGRENTFFSLQLMGFMHDRARATMAADVHLATGSALAAFGEAEAVLTELVNASVDPAIRDVPVGFSSRATEVASTFTKISGDVEELLRRWDERAPA